MPRLIFKCPYIKGGTSSATAHLENYVKYMATRNGVERIDPGRSEWPATSKQKKMVEQILRDFPLSRGMFEYEDYAAEPTRTNASEFITRALEDNYNQIAKKDNYLKYIATRPPAPRHIRRKIQKLQQELEDVRKVRRTQRRRREKNAMPVVALVGYTNAGKSTLLNCLTGSDIPANDRLFDTLDTTTRRWRVDAAQEVLLSDTVGFIRKLPTHLVEAFKATLEELTYADVLLHVIDLSNPEWEAQADVVDRLIDQLGAAHTPCIRVFNKCDAYLGILPHGENIVCISARSGEGANELTERVRAILGRADHHVTLLLPYAQGALLETLHRDCAVLRTDYRDDGIALEVIIHPEQWPRLEPFVIPDEEV